MRRKRRLCCTAASNLVMRALVFNPGSNSLKFEVIDTVAAQRFAHEGTKRVSGAIESFGKPGKQPTLSLTERGKVVHQQDVQVEDFRGATEFALDWMRGHGGLLESLDFIGVRVVHGGSHFDRAVQYDEEVRRKVESLEELAPLHNRSSLSIIDAVQPLLPGVAVAITLDTAFHRTLPEVAWRYPIDRAIADRHGIRKYGFHGVSHRYMLERYAQITGRDVAGVTLITLHLESGSSACAIRKGQSVDTSMGLTPLEGLMMGSRSGSVDPAIVEVLMRKEGIDVHAALDLLNKSSGLLGIGGDLDTRVLAKRDDDAARLALAMFGYRVRLMVGAYLAALGEAEAVIFGAGIGEDSPAIRAAVCDGLRFAGIDLDTEVNQSATQGEALISTLGSRVVLWSMPSEEGLQIAHECAMAFTQ